MKVIMQISVKYAATLMMIFLSISVVFHLLILTGVIPYKLVWSGLLDTDLQMVMYAISSITALIVVICVISIRGGYMKPFVSKSALRAILWMLVVLFLLGAVGIILSKTTLEMILFTPPTLISAILCYRMVLDDSDKE